MRENCRSNNNGQRQVDAIVLRMAARTLERLKKLELAEEVRLIVFTLETGRKPGKEVRHG